MPISQASPPRTCGTKDDSWYGTKNYTVSSRNTYRTPVTTQLFFFFFG